MKKIFFTALLLISALSLYSENCYKPAGHIECLLDLNSEKGQEIVKKVETEKRKMILEKNQKEWEYKDEETLESDGFDIFDSMFENFGK